MKLLSSPILILLTLASFASPSFAQAPKIVVSVRLSASFRITTGNLYSSTGGNRADGRITSRGSLAFDVRNTIRESLASALAGEKRYQWVAAPSLLGDGEDQIWNWQSLTYQRPKQLASADRLLLVDLVDIFAVEVAPDTYLPHALINVKLVDDSNKKNLWQYRSPQSVPRTVPGNALDGAMKAELQALMLETGRELLKKLK